MILHILIAIVAGWIQRHQQQVISYLQEENHVLKAQLGGRQLRLTDTQRRRLAALAHPLGRKRLKEVATLATPDTLLRWYQRLIAQKFDGSKRRQPHGRPRVTEEVEQLVIRMAEENATWGYRRIQGALANLGHPIDKLTVRNLAWPGDLLCARGHGAGGTACPYCRCHAASHRRLYAAMRPAVDRLLRRVPAGQAVSAPRPRYKIHAGI
jgi:hypothetical protein